MRTSVSSPACRQAAEVDDLVVTRAPAQALGIGARGALDEHLERAPDEALRTRQRVALHDLKQPFHPLHLDRMGHGVGGQRGRLGAAAR